MVSSNIVSTEQRLRKHNTPCLFFAAKILSGNAGFENVISVTHGGTETVHQKKYLLWSYLEACICRQIQKWHRYEEAFHASSCPCTSQWCSLSKWGGFCMGLWPHRRVPSKSAQTKTNKRGKENEHLTAGQLIWVFKKSWTNSINMEYIHAFNNIQLCTKKRFKNIEHICIHNQTLQLDKYKMFK